MQKLRTPSGIGEAAPSPQAFDARSRKSLPRNRLRRLLHGTAVAGPEPLAGPVPSLIFHTLKLFPMNLQLAPRNNSSADFSPLYSCIDEIDGLRVPQRLAEQRSAAGHVSPGVESWSSVFQQESPQEITNTYPPAESGRLHAGEYTK